MKRTFSLFAWLCSIVPAQAALAQSDGRVLGMEQALAISRQHAPELRQAAATTRAARARVETARAPLLPQISATASYARGTYNSALSNQPTGSWDTRNSFAAGLRATQLIYDFGQVWYVKEAAKENALAQEMSERATEQEIAYSVRYTFLSAGANRALVDVARATLGNQERHLAQIQGFVEVGTRPPIDLAQSRTDVANARLALLRAENNYLAGKAELSRAMGTPEVMDFEVSPELPPPEESESANLDALVQLGEKQRPEFLAFGAQLSAQRATTRSLKGQYGPSLSAIGTADENGYRLNHLAWNLSAGVSLSWSIYQGGLTDSRVSEANAQTAVVQAQLETLRQDLRVAVTQATLAIRAAQAALIAADELVQLAKERLTLAEGRYQTGVGNTIELGDAELALRDAQTQHVSAEYDLASARALLHRTLGRL
jgi:outer membrane protein